MKTIIVTGAGKGLGRAITEKLVLHQFKVLAVDVNENLLENLKKSFGENVETSKVDVSSENETKNYFKNLADTKIDGLVNNAGIYLGKNMLDYTSEETLEVMSVNLMGAIHFTKYFAKLMLERKHESSIVNMSSSSIYGGGDAVYSATKAGLVGLTKSCALKFSPLIRVNAVAPGIVETDILNQIPKEIIEWYRRTELVKKPLQPVDVANTVNFLLSDESRNYTGAVFDLNNGFHL